MYIFQCVEKMENVDGNSKIQDNLLDFAKMFLRLLDVIFGFSKKELMG